MSNQVQMPPINPMLIGVDELELTKLLELALNGIHWRENSIGFMDYSSDADGILINRYREKIYKLRAIEDMFVLNSVLHDDLDRTKGLEHIEKFINYLDIKAAICHGRDVTDDGDFSTNHDEAQILASRQESERIVKEIMASDTKPRRLKDLKTAYCIYAVARNRYGSYMLIEIYVDDDAKDAYFTVNTLIHVADTYGIDVNQVISDRLRAILYQAHNMHLGVYDIPLDFFKFPVTVL